MFAGLIYLPLILALGLVMLLYMRKPADVTEGEDTFEAFEPRPPTDPSNIDVAEKGARPDLGQTVPAAATQMPLRKDRVAPKGYRAANVPDAKAPVRIKDDAPAKPADLRKPLADAQTDAQGNAVPTADSKSAEVRVDSKSFTILEDYPDLNNRDPKFDIFRDNARTPKGLLGADGSPPIVVATFADGDDVATVSDFDPDLDVLEIESGGAVSFEAANGGADTVIRLNGTALFLIQGIPPKAMAATNIVTV